MSQKNSKNEIPLDKLKEITLFIKKVGGKEINISGGEPFLHSDFMGYLSFNKAHGIKSVIYTSGNFEIESVLNKFLINGITQSDVRVIFNYQSSDEHIFNQLNGINDNNTFKRVNNNLILFVANNFDVEAHIVPNALNLDTIYDTSHFLKENGVKKVSLLRIVYQGRAQTNKSRLYINQKEALPRLIYKLNTELGDTSFSIRIGIPYSNMVSLKTSCFAGSGKFIIKYDGKVFPCEAFKEAPGFNNYILGDIYVESLDEIWAKENRFLVEIKHRIGDSNCEVCPAQLLYK